MKKLILFILLAIGFSISVNAEEGYVWIKIPESQLTGQLEACGLEITEKMQLFTETTYLQVNGSLIQYRNFVEAARDANACTLANKICDFQTDAAELLIEIEEMDRAIDFVGQD